MEGQAASVAGSTQHGAPSTEVDRDALRPPSQRISIIRDHGLSIAGAEWEWKRNQSTQTSRPSLSTDSLARPLEEQLDNALVIPAQYQLGFHLTAAKHYFVPLDFLYMSIRPDSVRSCLQALKNPAIDAVEEIVDYVCGPPGVAIGTITARMLFTILLILEKPALIVDFHRKGLCDRDLPFSMKPQPERPRKFNFFKRTNIEVAVFDSWDTTWTFRFIEQIQWWVFVPFFAGFSSQPNPPLPIYHFYADVILPWSVWDQAPVPEGQEQNEVRRIEIHSSHHGFVPPLRTNQVRRVKLDPNQHSFHSVSLGQSASPY